MPRDGSGIYSKPAGTTVSPNTTIESAPFNALIDDLVTDQNAARPVVAGGTGANNVNDARTNLGLGSAAIESTIPVAKGGTGATEGRYCQNKPWSW